MVGAVWVAEPDVLVVDFAPRNQPPKHLARLPNCPNHPQLAPHQPPQFWPPVARPMSQHKVIPTHSNVWTNANHHDGPFVKQYVGAVWLSQCSKPTLKWDTSVQQLKKREMARFKENIALILFHSRNEIDAFSSHCCESAMFKCPD